MGLMLNGQWQKPDKISNAPEFIRADSQFRNWITVDGQAGKTGNAGFAAESNRYHLFVSLACPWAQRCLIFRTLKDLQNHIGVTVVEPVIHANGWELATDCAAPVEGLQYLYELYALADSDYSGRVTVPVLWDKKLNTIVSNESADIIRMFNSAFNHLTDNDYEFYFADIQEQIDTINDWVYDNLNNAVYQAGFAPNQAAYEGAYHKVFTALDELEEHLSEQRFLLGGKLSEADWRLFTTLVRFDTVYYPLFKLNHYRIEDYPNIAEYICELYQQPGIAETIDFDHIKSHYFLSHPQLNPTGIIPFGPYLDFNAAHNRRRFHE